MVEEKGKDERNIFTGGGPYIGGNVSAGRDIVYGPQIKTGRDSRVKIDMSTGVTVEKIRLLMAEVRRVVQQADLKPDRVEVLEADICGVEDEAQKKEPDKARMIHRLRNIAEVLQAAAASVTISAAGSRLPELVETIKAVIQGLR